MGSQGEAKVSSWRTKDNSNPNVWALQVCIPSLRLTFTLLPIPHGFSIYLLYSLVVSQ